jgi:hypothetical protein
MLDVYTLSQNTIAHYAVSSEMRFVDFPCMYNVWRVEASHSREKSYLRRGRKSHGDLNVRDRMVGTQSI